MKAKKWRILVYLVLNFFILFAVYRLFIRMGSTVGMILYMVAAAALTVAYYIMNHGFGKPEVGEDDLPAAWSHTEKCAYIDKLARDHERAKKLLYWLFPLILVLGLDVIDLFLLDGIKDALSSLG